MLSDWLIRNSKWNPIAIIKKSPFFWQHLLFNRLVLDETMLRRKISLKKSHRLLGMLVFEIFRKKYPHVRIASFDMAKQIDRLHKILTRIFITSKRLTAQDSFISVEIIRVAVNHALKYIVAKRVNRICTVVVTKYGNTMSLPFRGIVILLRKLRYGDYLTRDGCLYLAVIVRILALTAIKSAVRAYLREEGLIAGYDD